MGLGEVHRWQGKSHATAGKSKVSCEGGRRRCCPRNHPQKRERFLNKHRGHLLLRPMRLVTGSLTFVSISGLYGANSPSWTIDSLAPGPEHREARKEIGNVFRVLTQPPVSHGQQGERGKVTGNLPLQASVSPCPHTERRPVPETPFASPLKGPGVVRAVYTAPAHAAPLPHPRACPAF